MTSKLPNLLPFEAYKPKSSYLQDVAKIAAIYGPLVFLGEIWSERPHGIPSLLFRIVFFALVFALFGRSTSHWKSYFNDSGEGRLCEPPPAESIYQVVCEQGILFFSADRIRFIPRKRLGSSRPWKKPVTVEFLPLESIKAVIVGSSSRNWLGWWPQIEITAANSRLVTRVPDAVEAVAQIGRAVETLSLPTR